MPRLPLALAFAALLAGPAAAHEFWIEAGDYTPPSGAAITGQLKNGQEFTGKNQVYFRSHFTRFDMVRGDRVLPVEGKGGDLPALAMVPPEDGLWSVVHETTPRSVVYESWDKFEAFAAHKDFPDIRARHAARGLPETEFTESYTRHVKALIGTGDAEGADADTGMETEFVALLNPYTDSMAAGLPVRLLYQGAPRGDAQVEIFDRAPDGGVTISTTRTDAAGLAVITVAPGHVYLLDAVVLRPAPEGSRGVWETLWAALTFAVP